MRPAAVLLIALMGCGPKRADYPHQGGLLGQLEAEVIALKMRNRALADALAACEEDGGRPGAAYADLYQLFSGTEVAVTRRGGRVVVTMPVHFLYADRFTLRFREEATQAIDLLATALGQHRLRRLEVHGHTDDRELAPKWARRYRTHNELSYHQAAAFAERLAQQFEVEAARIAIVAHGATVPIAPNETEDGVLRNQRLAIHILPAPTED